MTEALLWGLALLAVSLAVGIWAGWALRGFVISQHVADDGETPLPVVRTTGAAASPSTPQRYIVELIDGRGKVISELGVSKRSYNIYHPPGVAWELTGKSTRGVYQYRRAR